MKYFKYLIIILIAFNFNLLNAEEKNLQGKITKNLLC